MVITYANEWAGAGGVNIIFKEYEKNKFLVFFVAVFIILLIILFVVSLGTIDLNEIDKAPKGFKDSEEATKIRQKKLIALIEKQEALKVKLNRIYTRVYFFVRLGFIVLWAGIISAFYFAGFIHNLGDILNYSEASILVIIVLNFLTFGNISNLENYLDIVKKKTENWIFGKYLKIDDKIASNKDEVKRIDK